jgi:hypothetical protein
MSLRVVFRRAAKTNLRVPRLGTKSAAAALERSS